MHLLDQHQLPGAARSGTTDKCTHICICNDGTGVCARAPHARQRSKRLGSRGVCGLMMNWLSSFLRGPLFLRSVPRAPPTLARASTPVTYDGTPIRRFWTNTRQLCCGQSTSFFLAASPQLPPWRSGLRLLLQHRKRYGYICTSVNVHNYIPGRGSLLPCAR
jgi:hypothetical protein